MSTQEVWLRFEDDNDDEATYEAELTEFVITEGDDEVWDQYYIVEWWHADVGQVSERRFDTYDEAAEFLTRNGYADYTA